MKRSIIGLALCAAAYLGAPVSASAQTLDSLRDEVERLSDQLEWDRFEREQQRLWDQFDRDQQRYEQQFRDDQRRSDQQFDREQRQFDREEQAKQRAHEKVMQQINEDIAASRRRREERTTIR